MLATLNEASAGLGGFITVKMPDLLADVWSIFTLFIVCYFSNFLPIFQHRGSEKIIFMLKFFEYFTNSNCYILILTFSLNLNDNYVIVQVLKSICLN